MRTQLFHPGCLDCSPLSPSRRTDAWCCVPSACCHHFAVSQSGAICCLPSLHRPPMVALINFSSVIYISAVLIFHSHYRLFVDRRFGSFTTPTEGRSIAPRCKRHFLFLFVTDLALFLLSSPLLEACRLSPVHLSYFLYFI